MHISKGSAFHLQILMILCSNSLGVFCHNMLTALKFSIMKHKPFPCENSFGINLQYDEKSCQKIMVRFIINKQTSTTLYVISRARQSYLLNDREV